MAQDKKMMIAVACVTEKVCNARLRRYGHVLCQANLRSRSSVTAKQRKTEEKMDCYGQTTWKSYNL